MIVHCPACRANVTARVVGIVEVQPQFGKAKPDLQGSLSGILKGFDNWNELIADPARTAWPARVSLLECPGCKEAIVIRQLQGLSVDGWMEPYRIWPDPERSPFEPIPENVRSSLQEARRCLSCGAYTASVAMTGRGLEAIARHFHIGPDPNRLMLGEGLKELHDNKVIDDRLFEWGKELHEHRNLAAHASGTSFERVDAQDLLDFALAICDYVFILKTKYDDFIKRKTAKQGTPKT